MIEVRFVRPCTCHECCRAVAPVVPIRSFPPCPTQDTSSHRTLSKRKSKRVCPNTKRPMERKGSTVVEETPICHRGSRGRRPRRDKGRPARKSGEASLSMCDGPPWRAEDSGRGPREPGRGGGGKRISPQPSAMPYGWRTPRTAASGRREDVVRPTDGKRRH